MKVIGRSEFSGGVKRGIRGTRRGEERGVGRVERGEVWAASSQIEMDLEFGQAMRRVSRIGAVAVRDKVQMNE